MKVIIVIVSIFFLYCIIMYLLYKLLEHVTWQRYEKERNAKKAEKVKFGMKHAGLNLFHLPFNIDEREVIFVESKYDEKANQFVKENFDKIQAKFSEKGYSLLIFRVSTHRTS